VNIERLTLVGASFRTSPQDFRDELESRLAGFEGPIALLATCNRVEAYFWSDSQLSSKSLLHWLSAELPDSNAALSEQLYVHSGMKAAHHLMRVAGGLDSLVVGEDQILGQVRSTGRSIAAGTGSDRSLTELFRQAVTAGRRIHAGHRLARDTSMAEASIHWLAESGTVGLRGATVTLLGAGKMARSAAATLVDSGVARLLLLNRSVEHAEAVAARLGRRSPVEPHPLSDLTGALRESDVVVGATRSPRPIVMSEHLVKALGANGHKNLVLLDLATPRDFEPAMRDLPGVKLFDLDDLGSVLGERLLRNDDAVEEAEDLARRGADAYARWLRVRDASSSIVAYRRKASRAFETELAALDQHLAAMAPAQRDAVRRSLRRLSKRLMHGPTLALRRAAAAGLLTEVAGMLDVPATRSDEKTGPIA
jgi:glutamyl-tRNA reductase